MLKSLAQNEVKAVYFYQAEAWGIETLVEGPEQ